jgi:trk system potassium uptake protein TrkA
MYVLVAGGGHMGTHLVARLVAEGHDAAVIDMDPRVTERIFAEQGVVVFTGNATDLNILEQAGLKRADVAVAMTGRDSDNLSFCLLARYFGVPRVLARMLNPQYAVPYRLVGATKVHSEADILVGSFLTSISYPEVGALMPLGRGELVIIELRIPEGSRVAGQEIATIVRRPDFPGHCVFIGVETDEGVAVADGKTVVTAGTTLILAAQRKELGLVVKCLSGVDRPEGQEVHTAAVESLRTVGFLSGLPADDLAALAAGSALETRKKGEVVYERGQPGDRMYVLRAGAVKVEIRGGKQAVLRPPAFFGERSAVTGHARTRTISAEEDSEILAVDGAALRTAILRNPFVAVEVAKLLTERPGA